MKDTPDQKQMRTAAAEYLERPLQLERRIRELIERRQEIEQSGLHGIDYSNSGGSRSADSTSRTEKKAMKAAALEEEHEELFIEWSKTQLESLEVIRKVQEIDARSALALTYTCISGLSAARTAEAMDLSERHVVRLRQQALQLAYKVMTEQEPPEPEANEQAKSGPISKEALP